MDKRNKKHLNHSPKIEKKENEKLKENVFAGEETAPKTQDQNEELLVEVQVPDPVAALHNEVAAVSPTIAVAKTPPQKPSGWATMGFVLSIFAFISMIIAAFSTFSFLVVVLFYIVIALILAITLGLILLNEGFVKFLDNASRLQEFSMLLSKIGYYMCYGIMGLSALSITLLAINKNYSKRTAGLVLSIVALVLSVIMLIAHFFAPFGYFEITKFIN